MPNKKKGIGQPAVEPSKAKVVKINKGEKDEVFFHSEDPYENFAVYSEPGTYKVGDSLKDDSVPATTQGIIEPVAG